MENKSARAFLDGVTAGVVGLIGATALGLLNETITHLPARIIFSLASIALFRSKWTVAIVVLVAGLFGLFALYEEMLLFKKIAPSRVRGAP